MIVAAEIISQPYSGEYIERIYDNDSAWNSPNWSSIKFTNDDHTEWCGQFRGLVRQVAISLKYNVVLVLTSDYLFHLDRETGSVIGLEDQPQANNLTVAPNGDFILADYYHLERTTTSTTQRESIPSPIEMEAIKFKGWSNSKLEFRCDEFTNWDRHLIMAYDHETNAIEIVNAN